MCVSVVLVVCSSISGAFFLEKMGEWERQRVRLLSLFLFFVFVVVAL